MFLHALSSGAQELLSFNLSNRNGLPSNVIYNMLQDTKGYIWMTGNEGLFRYDGSKYTIFKSDRQTSTAGSHIHADRLGRIWYENFDGYLYYVEEDSLKTISQHTPAGFVPYGITEQYLFVPQQKGIDIFDIRTLALIKTLPLPIEEPEGAAVNHSSYYFIADDIIYRIDPLLRITRNTTFKGKGLKVKYIYPCQDQLYILSKNNEKERLYFMDKDLNIREGFSLPGLPYIQGSAVIEDNIWIYTSKGLYIFDTTGRQTTGSHGLFKDQSISGAFRDYQHNYWIGSVSNGVYIAPDIRPGFYPTPGHIPSRIEKIATGYAMGTRKGEVLLLDRHFGIRQHIHRNDDDLPVSYIYNDPTNTYTVYASQGFNVIRHHPTLQNTHYNIALKQMVKVDEKYAAYAASGFCALYRHPGPSAALSSPWDSLYNALNNDIPNTARILKGVRGKATDYNIQQQKIVFATNIGLFLITPYATREVRQNGQPFHAADIFWTGDNLLALDTKGNLFSISGAHDFELLNTRLQLPPFSIRSIKRYEDSFILTTAGALYIYYPSSGNITTTPHPTGNLIVTDVMKEKDRLIVLTPEGILQLDLTDTLVKVLPRFFINRMRVNNTRVNRDSLLHLNYNTNNLLIDFSLLEYSGNNVPLHYRINGKDWTEIPQGSRTLQFPSLAPGSYRIEFKVGDTITTEQLQVNITAPFWATWWFYLTGALTAGGLVYLYFKRERNMMRKQIRLLREKMVLEKNLSKSVLTSIKSQMNPHFFYNALNTIQAYIFTNDRHNANTYLAKFSKLTRMILEMSEKETISLSEEQTALQLYLELEKMRFKDSFEYHLIVRNIADKEHIELPPMLIQPYVENAIKHGLLHREKDRELFVIFEQDGMMLSVTIEDNGIGRKRSEELNSIRNEKHRPFSTKANETRLEILNRRADNKMAVNIIDKYDANGLATGTTVVLSIPLN